MLHRIKYLYPPVVVLLSHIDYPDLQPLRLTEIQWDIIQDILLILDVAHAAQELLAAERTPTLSMALPVFETLIQNWLKLQNEIPELSHYIGVGISKLQEYVAHARRNRIYALAMSMFHSLVFSLLALTISSSS